MDSSCGTFVGTTFVGTTDDDKYYRLESLKLAYEMAFKSSSNYISSSKTPEKNYEAMVSIIDMADINLEYIKTGKIK